MDDSDVLTSDLIRNYLIQNGGKVSNHELVKHFKSYLTHPNKERQEEAKLLFRDTINTLASLKQENGVKFVVLKKKYRNTSINDTQRSSSPSHSLQTPCYNAVWPQGKYSSFELPSPSHESTLQHSNLVSPESDFHLASRSLELYLPSEIHSTPVDLSMEEMPQAPPRRRLASKEGLGTKIEEKLRELNKENDTKAVQKDNDLSEPMVMPGIVKERKEKLNKIVSESNIRTMSPLSISSSSIGKANFKLGTNDDDTSSVASLSPYRREWTIKAAKGDYNSLARMLKEEPRLANFKDIVSGFTALHWAAKLGNSDIVKLLAGKHHANPNARSHGGYTPLHMAAMFKRLDIMELLKVAYGANPSIRDYGGKKAEDYLPKKTVTAKESKTLNSSSSSLPLPSRTRVSLRTTLHQSFLRTRRPTVRTRSTVKKHRPN